MEKYKELPLETIDDPNCPARLNPEDPEVIELAESIRSLGLINPLRVKAVGDRFEVIAGHRRLLACRMISFSPVPCTIQEKGDGPAYETMLAENVARLDLTPIEEAAMIEELRENKNYGRKTVAKVLGKSEAWVQQRIDLLKIPRDLQQAVHERGLACSTAMRLAEVDDEDLRKKWIKDILHHGISARTVVLWVNSYKISKEMEETVEDPRELVEGEAEPYVPKGTCWVCNGKFRYEKLKNVMLCHGCYIELLRAITQGDSNAGADDRAGDTPGGNSPEGGSAAVANGREDGDPMQISKQEGS